MKNLFKVCAICAIFGVAVNAQEGNGVFLGFEAGAGEQKLSLTVANTTSTNQATAILFGGKLGYKHFFNDWIGIRGYVGVDYAETRAKSESDTSDSTGVFSNISYTANVDALLNFYNAENVAVGVFAGLGIGGQTAKDDRMFYNDKVRTITDLYSDVKVGLRVSAANHGMEFIAKIPLNDATKTFKNELLPQGQQRVDVKAKYRQPYQVMLGYNYAF